MIFGYYKGKYNKIKVNEHNYHNENLFGKLKL